MAISKKDYFTINIILTIAGTITLALAGIWDSLHYKVFGISILIIEAINIVWLLIKYDYINNSLGKTDLFFKALNIILIIITLSLLKYLTSVSQSMALNPFIISLIGTILLSIVSAICLSISIYYGHKESLVNIPKDGKENENAIQSSEINSDNTNAKENSIIVNIKNNPKIVRFMNALKELTNISGDPALSKRFESQSFQDFELEESKDKSDYIISMKQSKSCDATKVEDIMNALFTLVNKATNALNIEVNNIKDFVKTKYSREKGNMIFIKKTTWDKIINKAQETKENNNSNNNNK